MFEQPTATFDRRHHAFFNDSAEARQVWALDTTRRQIVYLPDGGVDDAVRVACHEARLRCPVARCPDPRLIAKGGTRRRHHFAHKVAHTAHDNAAIFRTQAVAMLASWARRYRDADISARHEDDIGVVTIGSLRTGATSELAVTYDPRHDEQGHRGPGRQLLLGHTRALLLPRAEHPQVPGAWYCGDARLVGDLIAAHDAALAINPEHQLVATVLETAAAERAGLIPAGSADYPTVCLIDSIDTCRLDEHGSLVTPKLRVLREWLELRPNLHRRVRTRRQRGVAPQRTPNPPSTRADFGDIELPVVAHRVGAPRWDINRVLVSGRVIGPAARRRQADDRDVWALAVAINDHEPNAVVEVRATAPTGTPPPPNGCCIIADGHLDGAATGRLAVVADHVERYSANPPTSSCHTLADQHAR